MNENLAKIVSKARTENQVLFSEWFMQQTGGMKFKTKAEAEAFKLGLQFGCTSYWIYQAEKRDAKRAAAKPATKRTRKAA